MTAASAGRRPDRRLPNFIYIGPDKAGSSWLHEVLMAHPQVFMPEAKDLYFFDRYYERGLDWYLDQFDGAQDSDRVIGEVCQDYLFEPSAPTRIRDSLGEPRLMVTLRDPADRAYSSYLYMLKQGQKPGTFREALRDRPELLEHGRYATGLRRYCEVFGPEALYLAVFDDLVAAPQRFVSDLLDWLDLDPVALSEELLAARLPAARARSTSLSRFARAAADVARERFDGANLVGRVKRSARVQRLLYVPLGDDRPTMTESDRAAVQDALAGEVADLDAEFDLGLGRRWGWSESGSGPRAEDVDAR